MRALVGCTGFVGSNLCENGQFDRAYHARNIRGSYGLKPDLLVYAGLRAEKYLAEKEPNADMQCILQAQENISKIAPHKLVLISTVDVIGKPVGTDENSGSAGRGLHAYGKHRYCMECWVREHYPDALIIRLPGLFGKHLKKNFIFDILNPVPGILSREKMEELAAKDFALRKWYVMQENGFYKCRDVCMKEKKELCEKFEKLGFTALNFTDSRSRYQFYPLERLWSDMKVALENDIRLLHLATEPVSAGDLYRYLTGSEFYNELSAPPAEYDFRTVYDSLYGGKNGYILDAATVKEQIRQFVWEYRESGGLNI